MSAIPFLVVTLVLAGSPAPPKVKVVFSVDQGFGNGIVVNRDAAGMKRIVEAMNTLRPAYDVYPLFEPLGHILLDAEQASTKDKTAVPASSPAPMAR